MSSTANGKLDTASTEANSFDNESDSTKKFLNQNSPIETLINSSNASSTQDTISEPSQVPKDCITVNISDVQEDIEGKEPLSDNDSIEDDGNQSVEKSGNEHSELESSSIQDAKEGSNNSNDSVSTCEAKKNLESVEISRSEETKIGDMELINENSSVQDANESSNSSNDSVVASEAKINLESVEILESKETKTGDVEVIDENSDAKIELDNIDPDFSLSPPKDKDLEEKNLNEVISENAEVNLENAQVNPKNVEVDSDCEMIVDSDDNVTKEVKDGCENTLSSNRDEMAKKLEDGDNSDDSKSDDCDSDIEMIDISNEDDSLSTAGRGSKIEEIFIDDDDVEEGEKSDVEKEDVDVSSFDKSGELPDSEVNESSHLIDLSGKDSNSEKSVAAKDAIEADPLKKLSDQLSSIQKDSKDGSGSKSHSVSNKENRKESSKTRFYESLNNEETGFPELFTDLVKIGRYIAVKGDFTLKSSEALLESPSLTAPFLLKEPDVFPARETPTEEPKDYFRSAAGDILIGIGLSQVTEWYHRDMTRVKKKLMKKDPSQPQHGVDLAKHEKIHAEAKKINSVYASPFKKCKTCGFQSESALVLDGHSLIPHLLNREYNCNFCELSHRDSKVILQHMLLTHNKKGHLMPQTMFFECPYCMFETNSKVKLNNHFMRCQKFFNPKVNQAPPRDFEQPGVTVKPLTVAVVKAYEKECEVLRRKNKPKHRDIRMNHMLPNQFQGSASSAMMGMQSQLMQQMLQQQKMPPMRPSTPLQTRFLMPSAAQMMPSPSSNHLQMPFPNKKQPNFMQSVLRPKNDSPVGQLPTLPRLQGPYPVSSAMSSLGSSPLQNPATNLIVCEICDGYIKDLDQMRSHMQLIHKVKIHPKMLVSRPPLNCQKCSWRFFTDQGLERHLLGSHGLVTSNMQELANKGMDAGCCTICGRVYTTKLVSHMSHTHKTSLKPAHLSYKCTVCSATFGLYRLFENHVYLVHSGAGKRQADGQTNPSKKAKTDNEIKRCECGKCDKCLGLGSSQNGTKMEGLSSTPVGVAV